MRFRHSAARTTCYRLGDPNSGREKASALKRIPSRGTEYLFASRVNCPMDNQIMQQDPEVAPHIAEGCVRARSSTLASADRESRR